MADLFLSYKAEDRSRVAPLVQALEMDGYSVWWDAHIGGGDRWRDTILRELEAAACVIVVWSKRSVGPSGEFVRDEASRAMRRGAYLPVRIDKVDPPLGFGETQALDLKGWKGDRGDRRYQALLAALRSRLGGERVASAVPEPGREGLDRRTVLIASTAAAVAAVATSGTWYFTRSRKSGDNSIAVLPFANLSGDPGQAYFSDGMAEELRTVLSRIPHLDVVARTSSEAVRNADAKTAASKLHVDNILSGSVRRSPAMLRVSAQLVDGKDGTERWSDVYDRPAGDLLQVQTDIANMVAQALSIHLGADERRALNEGGTNNPEALNLLLQAQEIVWRSDDAPSVGRAMELVDRALALDPKFGDGLTAKAYILAYLGGYLGRSAADANAKREAAEKLAREAIRVSPRSAAARGALADILWGGLQLKAGLAEFSRMAKLPGATSSYFSGFDSYAFALAQCHRFEEAAARAERVIAADPLNPYTYSSKAMTLASARRYSEAEQVIRQAIELGPEMIWPRAFRGYYLMQMGRVDEAGQIFTSIGGDGPWLAWAAIAAERQGNRPEADRLVSVMQKSMGDGALYQYAQVFAQQGHTDQAIAALEDGLAKIDPGLTFAQVDPLLDPVRKHPRFQALIKRLDFPT